MRHAKTYLTVSLFSCVGFIVGFVICHALFVPSKDEKSSSSPLIVELSSLPPTNIVERQDMDPVRIMKPTFPPQFIGGDISH